MEFRIKKIDFLRNLSLIQGVSEKKTTMPILAYTLIEAEEEEIKINATNLQISLTNISPAQVFKKGKITLPARKLYEIVRELPGEEIEVEEKGNFWIKISSQKSIFNLVGLPPEEFPLLEYKGEERPLYIETNEIKKMIDKTYFAMSNDESRPNLNGILFEIQKQEKGDILKLVATDGYRLALVERRLEDNKKELTWEGRVILPKKGVYELKKILDSQEDPHALIQFNFEKNLATIKKGNLFMAIRLIEDEFPDYQRILPQNQEKKLIIEKNKILFALKRVSLLTTEKNQAIKFSLSPQTLKLASSSSELGEAYEELEVEYIGEDIETGLSAKYLLQALEVVEGEKTRIELNTKETPVVVKSEEEEDYLCIIMPMVI